MKRIQTTQENELYALALDWYEDHRKVSRTRLLKCKAHFSYNGLAYRVSKENNFGSMTSWSKSKQALRTYSEDKPTKSMIDGIDMQKICEYIMHLDPKNIDLHEIILVQEIIKL